MNFDSIFKVMDDYGFDDYDNFEKSINNSYYELSKNHYIINNELCPKYSLSLLGKDDLHDRFAIDCEGVRFDCLMTPYTQNSKSLFIIFSGARSLDKDVLPVFKRWSYYMFIDSIVLNIADPMFYEYDKLKLGWYYGNKERSYIKDLSIIITKVRELLGIDTSDLYLFGSSGGGYVALQLSMYLKNATYIAINPQLKISRYSYAKEFMRLTGVDFNELDVHRRDDTINIVKDNINSNSGKFLILQNVQEKSDCVDHFFPLLRNLGIEKLHLGLNDFNNLTVWLYSCVGGHNAQGDQIIFSHILYLAKKLSSSCKITAYDHFLIKNISCIWKQLEWYKFRTAQLSNSSGEK